MHSDSEEEVISSLKCDTKYHLLWHSISPTLEPRSTNSLSRTLHGSDAHGLQEDCICALDRDIKCQQLWHSKKLKLGHWASRTHHLRHHLCRAREWCQTDFEQGFGGCIRDMTRCYVWHATFKIIDTCASALIDIGMVSALPKIIVTCFHI